MRFVMILFRGRGRNQRFAMMMGLFIVAGMWAFSSQRQSSNRGKETDRDTMEGKLIHEGAAYHKYNYKNESMDSAISCSEKKNFVYIKEIKCASQTLASIFRRFGYVRHLSFVLPVGDRLYLGWPYDMKTEYFRPTKTGTFNILCEHSIYNEQSMKALMPPDTIYITSLRQPFAQFKSMFNYYNFQKILNISSSDPVAEYLYHLEKYESLYTSPSSSKIRFCVPNGFTMSRNLMSYILGFPTGFLPNTKDMTNNVSFIRHWIDKLDKQFSVVLITEYFHESLVLLKRIMCWNLEDIIYFSQNVGSYGYKGDVDVAVEALYRRHSQLDYQLYDHFNKTFWFKVYKMQNDFFGEVNYFTALLKDITTFCNNLVNKDYHSRSFLKLPGTRWNKPFHIGETQCKLMMNEDSLKVIKERYDNTYPKMDQRKPNKYFC